MSLAFANVELLIPVLETHRDLIVMLPTINVNALQASLLVAFQVKHVNRAVACVEVVQAVMDNQLGRTAMLEPAHANVLQV